MAMTCMGFVPFFAVLSVAAMVMASTGLGRKGGQWR